MKKRLLVLLIAALSFATATFATEAIRLSCTTVYGPSYEDIKSTCATIADAYQEWVEMNADLEAFYCSDEVEVSDIAE